MVKNFTKENLQWESLAKYPECSFKGSDTRLMLGWLVDWMYTFNIDERNEICASALAASRCMDDFLRLVYTQNRLFLSREQGFACLNLLKTWYVKTMWCARACYDQKICFFNLTPKYHYLMHVGLDLERQLQGGLEDILSPGLFATQMAEEYIGKSCRVARTTHPCTAVKRTAQKWMVHCKQWFDEEPAE